MKTMPMRRSCQCVLFQYSGVRTDKLQVFENLYKLWNETLGQAKAAAAQMAEEPSAHMEPSREILMVNRALNDAVAASSGLPKLLRNELTQVKDRWDSYLGFERVDDAFLRKLLRIPELSYLDPRFIMQAFQSHAIPHWEFWEAVLMDLGKDTVSLLEPDFEDTMSRSPALQDSNEFETKAFLAEAREYLRGVQCTTTMENQAFKLTQEAERLFEDMQDLNFDERIMGPFNQKFDYYRGIDRKVLRVRDDEEYFFITDAIKFDMNIKQPRLEFVYGAYSVLEEKTQDVGGPTIRALTSAWMKAAKHLPSYFGFSKGGHVWHPLKYDDFEDEDARQCMLIGYLIFHLLRMRAKVPRTSTYATFLIVTNMIPEIEDVAFKAGGVLEQDLEATAPDVWDPLRRLRSYKTEIEQRAAVEALCDNTALQPYYLLVSDIQAGPHFSENVDLAMRQVIHTRLFKECSAVANAMRAGYEFPVRNMAHYLTGSGLKQQLLQCLKDTGPDFLDRTFSATFGVDTNDFINSCYNLNLPDETFDLFKTTVRRLNGKEVWELYRFITDRSYYSRSVNITIKCDPIIVRHEGYLPVGKTCFQTLIIFKQYRRPELLYDKLKVAIAFRGYGFA